MSMATHEKLAAMRSGDTEEFPLLDASASFADLKDTETEFRSAQTLIGSLKTVRRRTGYGLSTIGLVVTKL